MVNHELMKSLEYDGPYGGRYLCRDCTHCSFKLGNYQSCDLLHIDILPSNNICRAFKAHIHNPSAPKFNFDDYLEYLGSDFYRPWSVDTDIIVGESWGNIGLELDKNGMWRSKFGKITHYKPYDKPYCRTNFPRCHVQVSRDDSTHKFEIDYRLYREQSFIKDGELQFVIHLWKDKPKQCKYCKEINGRWSLNV